MGRWDLIRAQSERRGFMCILKYLFLVHWSHAALRSFLLLSGSSINHIYIWRSPALNIGVWMMLSVAHIIVLLLLKCWYVLQPSLQWTLSQWCGCSFFLINKLFELFLKILWSFRIRKVEISSVMFVRCIQKLHVLLLLMRYSIIDCSMIGTSHLICILNICIDVAGSQSMIGFELSHLRERSIYNETFKWIVKVDAIIKT